MLALVDGDIIPYEFGGMVQLEDPDEPLAWEIVRKMVDDRIHQIMEATNATEYSMYLTDSASNFRMTAATILPYKGHRKTEKPYHWEAVRQHLIDNWNAEVQVGIEADDRLGIEQYKTAVSNGIGGEADAWTTVICSRDKDLHMIPGWHYSWPAGKQQERLWFQDETNAIRCFYRQLLTGDTTDNILGLYGVGGKSKLVLRLEELDSELDMFRLVHKAYKDRFGTYAMKFLIENGVLLWMLREEPVPGYPNGEAESKLRWLLKDMQSEAADEQLE